MSGANIFALFLSLVAIAVSLYTFYQNHAFQTEIAAMKRCDEYYLGGLLKDAHETRREWTRSGGTSSQFDDATSRAFGDVFNFLAITATGWETGTLDTEVLRECMGHAFDVFCDPELLSLFDTRWDAVEELVQSPDFWASDTERLEKCKRAVAGDG